MLRGPNAARHRATVEAAPIPAPSGKRVAFGLPAFAVPEAGNNTSVVLRWPAAPNLPKLARLRVTVALDIREEKLVEARTARTGEHLGTFDIRYASLCQPFEIIVTGDKVANAIREGVRLQMTKGEIPLWLFADGNIADSFAPHWLGETTGDTWAQFEALLCSVASVQAFGWIEGCVLDGLWQRAQLKNGNAAKAAIKAHLQLFLKPDGTLDYEGPGSNPFHNAVYGMEGLLPFAIIARIDPGNPALKLAEREILSRLDSQKAVVDKGVTTTEGVYIAGYPLAVLAKVWKRDDLRQLALAQLRTRRDRNLIGKTIYQAVGTDGKARLPNWARGVAWYLLGFARVLDTLESVTEPADLHQEFRRAALWVIDFQQKSGLWRNFFDDDKSDPDTSGSAGIATALAVGARRGWLPESANDAARRTLKGLEAYLTPDGFLGGMAQFNKGGEALQRSSYRVMAPMAMGLAMQLRAELGEIT